MVLPAPVAPTMPMQAPFLTSNEMSCNTGCPLFSYLNETWRNDISPIGRDRDRALARSTTSGAASSRANARSALTKWDCIVAIFLPIVRRGL